MGLTSGYYSSLAMIYGPKYAGYHLFSFHFEGMRGIGKMNAFISYRTVESRHAPIAGMFGAAFLITGIFLGVSSIKLTELFVEHVSF
jgi:ABC-type transport system involved in cytochrome c biogenesis permease subunit